MIDQQNVEGCRLTDELSTFGTAPLTVAMDRSAVASNVMSTLIFFGVSGI